jgi:hypothetical protein
MTHGKTAPRVQSPRVRLPWVRSRVSIANSKLIRARLAVAASVVAGLSALAPLACREQESRPTLQPAASAPAQVASGVARPVASAPAAPVVFTREIEELVDAIAEGDRVESSHIYFAGTPSSQWQRYEQLTELATVAQLIALTDHQNAAVRCYAFQGLAAKYSERVFDVLLKHLTDDEIVDTQSGCIGMSTRVGDYLVEVVTMGGPWYQLNEAQRERLDRILLNDRSVKLEARSWALRAMKPNPGYYERVRELATGERNRAAVRLLAKYRNPADVALISTFFENESEHETLLYAAREFPHEAFYPLVTQIFEQEWAAKQYGRESRLCFQVLAQYPRRETLALFERTLKVEDEYRRKALNDDLLTAITKYPHELFEPLQSKLPPRRIDPNAPPEFDD